MGDLSKIQAGPCSVKYDVTDVGHTEEGIEFNYEPDIRERVVDEFGTTAVELVLIGENVTITVRIAEWVLANFKIAIPAGLDGASYLGIGRKPGFLLGSKAKQIVLHPLEKAAGDTSEDATFWKAVPNSPVAIGWNNDGDRIFEVVFKCLPDPAKPDGKLIGKIGAA